MDTGHHLSPLLTTRSAIVEALGDVDVSHVSELAENPLQVIATGATAQVLAEKRNAPAMRHVGAGRAVERETAHELGARVSLQRWCNARVERRIQAAMQCKKQGA